MLETKPTRTVVIFYTLLLAGFFAVAAILPAHAAVTPEEQKSREELASRMATMTLSVLQDQSKNMEAREEVLRNSFTRVMDTQWIAKFVLGNHWRTASDAQRARYAELYKEFITNVYVNNYAQSSERKIRDIKVMGIADADDEQFTTRTKLLLSTGENLSVDYRAHKLDKGYKIVDVIIEGVSLLASHRAEFGQLAAGKGVDAVIAKLEKLTSDEKQYAMLKD
jgi:phospholipid transport system substrate-binding protein